MSQKTASSEVTWALLTEGVAAASLEAHRIRHLYNRARTLVDASDQKEHLYEVGGDLIIGTEKRLDALERVLTRTSYALAKIGEDHLRDRLSLQDRNMVDDSVTGAGTIRAPSVRQSAAQRLAAVWLALHAED